MPTKGELEEEINERLETDIEWSELNKDDLEEFKTLTEDEEFIKTMVASYAGETTGELTKSAVSGWSLGSGLALLQDDDVDVWDLLL